MNLLKNLKEKRRSPCRHICRHHCYLHGRSYGNDLHYRGYDITELAKHATFEEVAYLLIHGELPNKTQLQAYHQKLKGLRGLPDALKKYLSRFQPARTQWM